MLLLLFLLLSFPPIQSDLAQRATKYLSKKYHTSIVVEKIDLSNFKDIQLKNVVIKDHTDFPFIKIKNLKTSINNWEKLRNNQLNLGNVYMDGLDLILKTYKNENRQNISIFLERFKSNKSKKNDFILTTNLIQLKNTNFYYYNENKQKQPIVFYNKIKGDINNFELNGPKITAHINNTSFIDNYHIRVKKLKTNFTYTRTKMLFTNTSLATKTSKIDVDMVMNYKREDLSDFNNKVIVNAKIKRADVSLQDLNLFYDELGKTDNIHFTGKFKGTLNNFKLNNLQLISDNNAVINGDLHFLNAINRENGFELKSDLSNLTSNYKQLKELLPNILGKNLPSSFAMLGDFTLKGTSHITTKNVDAQLEIKSELGTSISDLRISNIDNIDNATYEGNIELINFDLGKITNDKNIGKISMVADVKGIGFTQETLNTAVIGQITKHQYKGYTYQNIDVNGVFKNQHFNGVMHVDDPNIKLTFKGLADLSNTVYSFKFKADVAYANFNKLNLFKRDESSVLKGKIDIDLRGNSIDNIAGEINFTDASYTNQNDIYNFKNFDVKSTFNNKVRTLTVNSNEIINGKVKGDFKFNELVKLTKNSLGSIYTHYIPEPVSSGQFLSFNFKIHDKIIGVFYPEISVGKNTFIKGKINADNKKFELTFKSPKVKIFDNLAEKIKLKIDNKNPLFNTLFSVDKLTTKLYDLSDLNLVNVTLNDTLFMRTTFKGGQQNENYNLSVYHTINNANKSVVGFRKSDVDFKGQKWLINPKNNKNNKVVFDSNFKNFDFKSLKIFSGKQKLSLNGMINDNKNKNLILNFKNIDLEKITPRLDSITLNGLVNGKLNYLQKNGKVLPLIDLNIDNLIVNRIEQGDLKINAKGDKTFKKYDFNATLIQHGKNKLTANGKVDLSPKEPLIDAVVNIDKLKLDALSPLGGSSITKIRGEISGSTTLTGKLRNPNMNGELYVNNAGMAFPYLNTEYIVKGLQKVNLSKQYFDINTTTLVDIAKGTEAKMTGIITHKNFKKWFLNLNLTTQNLLLLNTPETEEIPYYGTGYIKGFGTIIGPTNNLVIDLTATTNPNTKFIVPLSDVNTIEENKLLHFVRNKENDTQNEKTKTQINTNNKGLTLLVDLTVTPDALTQIVIDKSTGSVLRGRGNANLDIDINTNGKFEMDGTFTVDTGVYELKYYVNKNFKVKRGGKVYWSGNPYDADLDIVAYNSVKANPSILLENIQSNRDIDVELITKITGNLYNPTMDFDINLPTASSLVQSELAYKINDENKKMTQFFSLLSLGTFSNIDEFSLANSSNSLIYGTLSERISSLISTFLQDDDDVLQVGVNYKIGDPNNKLDNLINPNDQVDITFKTNIYKKVIVNGVVGVPLGTNVQSSIVGEIEVELPLNKKENFNARAYNRKNEVQFDILDSEGYTQGLGISYEMTWDSTEEFLDKFRSKKIKEKRARKKKKEIELQKKKDSIENSKKKKLINFVK